MIRISNNKKSLSQANYNNKEPHVSNVLKLPPWPQGNRLLSSSPIIILLGHNIRCLHFRSCYLTTDIFGNFCSAGIPVTHYWQWPDYWPETSWSEVESACWYLVQEVPVLVSVAWCRKCVESSFGQCYG